MANTKSLLSFHELMEQLVALCRRRSTGTLFIASEDNRAVSFVLKEGDIISCSFGHFRGISAVEQIKQLVAGSCSFSEKIFFSLMEETNLPSTMDILELLGYPCPDLAELESLSHSHKVASAVYRGAVVKVEANGESSTVPPKKSLRMYRGQVVEQ